MTVFRIFVAALFAVVLVYTVQVGLRDGWNLLPVFFAQIRDGHWPGQFNVDFMSFLAMSAAWVAWRHRFSAAGLALAVVAFFGGGLFLTAYLFAVSFQATDARGLLLGPER